MKRSIKQLAFLDWFYKKFCCGARNHPESWKKEKHLNRKGTRQKLKGDLNKELESYRYKV